MKKPDKREHINLFFSAFLIIAFIICANFFSQFTKAIQPPFGQIVTVAVCAVFGLLMFYATRVGDGKAIKRFSPLTLIVLILPTLYIMIAAVAPFMPLHNIFTDGSNMSLMVYLAAVAFGYGLMYTFFSGFELAEEETLDDASEETKILAGGVEQDLLSENENSDILDDEKDIMDDYVEET